LVLEFIFSVFIDQNATISRFKIELLSKFFTAIQALAIRGGEGDCCAFMLEQ
jgi:hypothetical protein